MTEAERLAAAALAGCRLLPASFEKRFVRDLAAMVSANPGYTLSESQRAWLWRLVTRYRRQLFRDGERLSEAQVREHFERRAGRDAGMTESEWLASADPARMLAWITGGLTDGDLEAGGIRRLKSGRKLRLFACACHRHASSNFQPDKTEELLVVAEARADGAASDADLAREQIRSGGRTIGSADPASAARTHAEALGEGGKYGPARAALLRDIVGNPFHPVEIPESPDKSGWHWWSNGTVPRIAEAIYADRAFDRLPILADALEDAGCDDADVLAHCRGPGPHVRGCWVVDLLLGKE